MRERWNHWKLRLQTTCFDAGGPLVILLCDIYLRIPFLLLGLAIGLIVAVTVYLIRKAKKKASAREEDL